MNAKEILAAALDEKGMSQAKLAKLVGWPEQSIGQKVNVRESIRANEFFFLMEKLGYEILFINKETGGRLLHGDHRGRRLAGYYDHVKYDTKHARLVASSFYADGINEFGVDGIAQQLYVDEEGRYFVAEYFKDDPERDRIRSIPVAMAEAFIKEYGVNRVISRA